MQKKNKNLLIRKDIQIKQNVLLRLKKKYKIKPYYIYKNMFQ